MRKTTKSWRISELRDKINMINFPEYQREPNVWSRDAKQRLIDSIARRFDIASFYFYVNENENENENESWDCVDGRQRIAAIMSFLNEGQQDEHMGFELKILNEVFEDQNHLFSNLDGKTYEDIRALADNEDVTAQAFCKEFEEYTLTIVMLADSSAPEEFNLQFARLNLGTIINSGEKLNAMIGELRDLCFDDLGKHHFLASVPIPTRRFASEQLAAQVVTQVFAIEGGRESGLREFARTRHLDLQRLFKQHTTLGEDKKESIRRLRAVMDLLAEAMAYFPALRSRAIVLSTILLAYDEGIHSAAEAQFLGNFISDFVKCLKWQIPKGLEIDREYDYLVVFQRHLMQASVEKPAVTARAETLKSAYEYWQNNDQMLPGDRQYMDAHPDSDPRELRNA